jgi:hypothetical protein
VTNKIQTCRRLLLLAALLLLAGCSREWMEARERIAQANVMPADYKSEIVAMMRTYLNDPTQVRDAYVSEPSLRPLDGGQRYTVCLRYNARKSNGQYAGSKDSLVVFRDGRLDDIVDNARGMCKDAAYQPFHELETMTR